MRSSPLPSIAVTRHNFELVAVGRVPGWQDVLRELVAKGLLELLRRPVPTASFDERFRARNVYVVRHGAWTRPVPASSSLRFRQPQVSRCVRETLLGGAASAAAPTGLASEP